MPNTELARLGSFVRYGFWERVGTDHTTIRFATSWYTTEEDVDALITAL